MYVVTIPRYAVNPARHWLQDLCYSNSDPMGGKTSKSLLHLVSAEAEQFHKGNSLASFKNSLLPTKKRQWLGVGDIA